MKRAAGLVFLAAALALTSVVVSGAAGARTHTSDSVCTSLTKARNAHSYPPDRQWVWTIPTGCVFTRDLPRPSGCNADPELGCIAAPDVHVRFQRKGYVFHLTLKGSSDKALGVTHGVRLLVAHDGRGSKSRQRLLIDVTATEFDGIIPPGGTQIPNLGPILNWRIVYTLDKRKGLCCPHVDAGSPDVSPFDVVPLRLQSAPG
jgi:hypothetical protein